MAILRIDNSPTSEELEKLKEEFGEYIKLVADVDKGILYGGSRLHADIEKILINSGSLQKNIWGGGIDLISKIIECSAVANIRPESNPSTEILNPIIREKFIKLIKKYF
ncbi:MAG: DUF5674 family protein, partial [Candidatus Shapirobacteria bacterium]|nr:DUF5674 family protein [Candidatus Shapirobacteria bacterium]